jgi:hypothetical protein
MRHTDSFVKLSGTIAFEVSCASSAEGDLKCSKFDSDVIEIES